MKLTLKDRVLILTLVLPVIDTKNNILLKIAISKKIALSEDEKKKVTVTSQNGNHRFTFKDESSLTDMTSYGDITNDELVYLKGRVNSLDQKGLFSESNIDTLMKILDAVIGE